MGGVLKSALMIMNHSLTFLPHYLISNDLTINIVKKKKNLIHGVEKADIINFSSWEINFLNIFFLNKHRVIYANVLHEKLWWN